MVRSIWIIIIFYTDQSDNYEIDPGRCELVADGYNILNLMTVILLFSGLVLLLAGFLARKRRESHIVIVFGWLLFGVYWLTQIPHFYLIGDMFNAILCLLGFILFMYFAYHEILNFKWNENIFSLNYIAGVVAVGGLFYYLIEKIEPLAKGLIYIVSVNTVWLLGLFGFEAGIGTFGYPAPTYELSLDIIGSRIFIILACTGIQSIAIFVGILLVTNPDRKLWTSGLKRSLKKSPPDEIKASGWRMRLWTWKKQRLRKVLDMSDRSRFTRAFMYTIPVIYILNILRNALIIFGVEHSALGSPEATFDIAHNYLSKFLSLGALIAMVFIVFELLPECQEGVIGLLDLPNRVQPGMVKNGFIELPKHNKKKGSKKKPAKNKDNPRRPVKNK